MVFKEIESRYSTRDYSDKIPSDKIISKILEAGRLAPSWVNVQPWHFVAVKDAKTKQLLAELAHGQAHVEKAPVVIVVCGDLSAWERENYTKTLESRPGITPERVNTLLNHPAFNPKLKNHETVLARTFEQTALALAYMTLEAEEQKLNGCIIGGIGNELTDSLPEVYKKVKEQLNLPETMIITSLLLLGYPAKDLKKFPKMRRPESEVISYEKIQNS